MIDRVNVLIHVHLYMHIQSTCTCTLYIANQPLSIITVYKLITYMYTVIRTYKTPKCYIHIYMYTYMYLPTKLLGSTSTRTQCDTIDTTPGLEARLEIFRKSEVTSVLPFLRLLLPPASDSELEPSLDELPLLLLLLELLLEL